MLLFTPKTVNDDVLPAGVPATGGLARVLPQRLFSKVPTLFDEVEDIDFHSQNRIPRLHTSKPVLSADKIAIHLWKRCCRNKPPVSIK